MAKITTNLIAILMIMLLVGCTLPATPSVPTPVSPIDIPAEEDSQIVMVWNREGGIAGFCDEVTVFATGDVVIDTCRTDEPVTSSMSSAQLDVLRMWQATYQSFVYEQMDPATADAITMQLIFNGVGEQVAQELDFALMVDFVQNLVNELTIAANQPPPACLVPSEDQQLLVDEDNGFCLLYPAEYSLLYPSAGLTELVMGTVMNHMDPRLSISVTEAEGRTLETVTDQLLADYVPPGWEVEPNAITVDGMAAVMLDNLPGQDLNRRAAFIAKDRLYSFMLTPLGEEGTDIRDQAEALYKDVLDTFRFLEP